MEDRNGEFRKKFAPKISVLDAYAVEDDIQESRKMEGLHFVQTWIPAKRLLRKI